MIIPKNAKRVIGLKSATRLEINELISQLTLQGHSVNYVTQSRKGVKLPHNGVLQVNFWLGGESVIPSLHFRRKL